MAIDTISAATGIRPSHSVGSALYQGWLAYRAWRIRRRTRHALLDLTEDQLRDIGISRREAQREVAKSFYWD